MWLLSSFVCHFWSLNLHFAVLIFAWLFWISLLFLSPNLTIQKIIPKFCKHSSKILQMFLLSYRSIDYFLYNVHFHNIFVTLLEINKFKTFNPLGIFSQPFCRRRCKILQYKYQHTSHIHSAYHRLTIGHAIFPENKAMSTSWKVWIQIYQERIRQLFWDVH